jgi:hypothetical protein
VENLEVWVPSEPGTKKALTEDLGRSEEMRIWLCYNFVVQHYGHLWLNTHIEIIFKIFLNRTARQRRQLVRCEACPATDPEPGQSAGGRSRSLKGGKWSKN